MAFRGAVAVVAAIAILSTCAYFSSGNQQTASVVPPSPDTQPATDQQQTTQPEQQAAQQPAQQPAQSITVPQNEYDFIMAVKASQAAYPSADNDLKKANVRRDRDSKIAAAVPTSELMDWIGTIRELTTNGDGNGVVTIDIPGCVCGVKTWNNSLSDLEDHTLIPNGSDLYNRITNMKQGQQVKFSGRLFAESSFTIDGSLREPEWIVRFSDIRDANDQGAPANAGQVSQ